MKRVVLPVLMITILLTACGGAAIEEQIEARRDALGEAESIRFTADVRTDLGGEIFDCAIGCAATPERLTMEVLAPEIVAGVTATAASGKTALEYESVQLCVGGQDAPGPFSALPLLCEALRTGHVVRAWSEDDLVAAEFYAGDERGLIVWFGESDLTPVHAELSENGRVLVRCDISDFQT